MISASCQKRKLFIRQAYTVAVLSYSAIEGMLAQYSILVQRDKGPAFISLILEIVAQQDPALISNDIHTLVDTLINQDNIGLVVSRQVLSELVKILGGDTIKNHKLRKYAVKDILAMVQPQIISYGK